MKLDYRFIGWCHENGHDKVWVAIKIGDKYLTVWGARGKKLSTLMVTFDKMMSRIREKEDRYEEIDNLSDVYPDFERDLEKTAVWAILKG